MNRNRMWRPAAIALVALLAGQALLGFQSAAAQDKYPSRVVHIIVPTPAGAFLARTFVIFHDCTHGSYLSRNEPMRLPASFWASLCSRPIITGGGSIPFTTRARETWTGADLETCGR